MFWCKSYNSNNTFSGDSKDVLKHDKRWSNDDKKMKYDAKDEKVEQNKKIQNG